MKDKFKYLIKNTGVLFVSNFASKILVFLLVPFYTSILSTAEYGTYDLIYTTVQLIVPILTFNIVDSVIRFSIGNTKDNQDEAFTIGLKYIFISIVILTIFLFGLKTAGLFDTLTRYGLQFFAIYVSYAINNLICQFARGIDDVKGVAFSGVVGTVTMIALNLIFLLWLHLGLLGYFYAMSASLLLPAVFLFIKDKMWQYVDLKSVGVAIRDNEKEMLQYCLPLVFINLSWYINNVSDRYVVTWMCGIEENGIYSVSYKIPAILNAIQVVFIQAWQLSAIREYSSKDGEPFYRKTYQSTQVVMVTLCSILIAMTKVLSKCLFANEFYNAWKYVPILLIYIVFNTLSGVIGGIFSATKDSSKLAWTGIIGAGVNVGLNFVLIYQIGTMGAAVATVISSITIWEMRFRASRKHMRLQIRLDRHILQYAILFAQAVLMIKVVDARISIVCQLIGFMGIVLLNMQEIRSIKNDTI